MRTITEARALRQAKEIFNNTPERVDEKLIEELNEAIEAIKGRIYVEIIYELSDVIYMINQKAELMGTDVLGLLKFAIVKNERKRK